jgi:two-component system sensor histidine kinase MtrB
MEERDLTGGGTVGRNMGSRLRRGLGACARLVWDLPSRWRRSIQFRVVSVTMALSIAVAAGLGFFIAQHVATDILRTREDASVAQATSGFSNARQYLALANIGTDNRVVGSEVANLLCAGSAHGQQYQVAVAITQPQPSTFSLICGLDPDSLPLVGLRAEIRAQPDIMHAEFATIGLTAAQGDPVVDQAALLYAEQITTDNGYTAEVYFTFPLTQDQQTLDNMERAIGIAGLALVFALMGIAYFVTRQVVLPVRMAASIAERLAAGRLEVRMRAKGEDDLASLATSFNKMADNLQTKIKQLEELSRVQRRFVSDVSHELRTPLTTVRMAADLIHEERGSFEPTVGRSAELLQDQLDRFEELLADLLEISRFDAGAAVLDAEPVDLRDLVRRVVVNSQPLADRKGSVVVIDVPDEPCVAEVDTRRIDRVLRNLVVNAIEHGEGRQILIRVATAQDAIAVAVRDYGVGLRPGESSLVFNRFWRADPARARNTGGTGLGLAIALEDARLHHGWLQAWGEPGGGSQFRMTVPRTTGGELLRSPIPLEPEDSLHHQRQRRSGRGGPDSTGSGGVGSGSGGGLNGGPGGKPAVPVNSGAGARPTTTAVPWFGAGDSPIDDRPGEDQ